MKNKCFFLVFIISLFCFVSFGLFAQSTSIDQRLVGTWRDIDGGTWVFNSDGSGTFRGRALAFSFFSDNKLMLSVTGYIPETSVNEYAFLDNGRRAYIWNPMYAILLMKTN